MVTKPAGLILAERSARQVRLAVQALGADRNRHRAVHQARKAIRRLRSLLALGRAAFGDSFGPIDTRLKRLAHSLSGLRDAHVAAETALALADGDEPHAWREVTLALERRRDAILAQALLKDPAFSARRRRLTRLAVQIAGLPWDQLSQRDLHKALDHAVRRTAKAEATAELTRRPADMHRWRRRARHLRFQLEALESMRAVMEVHPGGHSGRKKLSARRLGKLTEKLGRARDLQILWLALKDVAAPMLMSRLKACIRHELRLLKT